MYREHRAVRRGFYEPQYATDSPQFGYSSRHRGSRRRQGPISQLISLAKPLVQEQLQKQMQKHQSTRSVSAISPTYQANEDAYAIQEQSYGTVETPPIPARSPRRDVRSSSEQEARSADNKEGWVDEEPRARTSLEAERGLPPTYEAATQVQHTSTPPAVDVKALARLSIGNEVHPAERAESSRSVESRVPEQRDFQRREVFHDGGVQQPSMTGQVTEQREIATQPQLSNKYAIKLQRQQDKAEQKLLRKAERYSRKGRRHL